MTQAGQERAGYRDVFAVGEFRALWLAQVTSVAGDQLARVALTVLVFERTHSALLAAVTYAASVLPIFFGGLLLSGLADRLPRRSVMIICELCQTALVLLMLIPRTPVAALVVLLSLVTLADAVFRSARTAIFPDILAGDVFVLGQAVALTTYQLAQVIGFAVGGIVVGFLGTRVSLLVDAVTFVVAAALVRFGVQNRPAASQAGPRPAPLADAWAGIRLVFGNPALRTPMLLGWLAAFYNAPEGVATPLAKALHGGPVAVGLILAAMALGATVGNITITRIVPPARRGQVTGPLAVACCGLLALFAVHPLLPAALLILIASGLFAGYQGLASSAFVTATPAAQRSQAFGLAQAGMYLGQGATMILAGAAADRFGAVGVTATVGAIGAAAALAVSVSAKSVNTKRR
jgi:predicted MFS family arabinose efflux permease